jgi:hypothetical protein
MPGWFLPFCPHVSLPTVDEALLFIQLATREIAGVVSDQLVIVTVSSTIMKYQCRVQHKYCTLVFCQLESANNVVLRVSLWRHPPSQNIAYVNRPTCKSCLLLVPFIYFSFKSFPHAYLFLCPHAPSCLLGYSRTYLLISLQE